LMSTETAALSAQEAQEANLYRLPRTVVPEKYEIRLEPDLSSFTFLGEEIVHLIVADAVKEIILNSLDLQIDEARLTNQSGEVRIAEVALNNESERATLKFSEVVNSGLWQLHLKFRGELNDKLHGFYRSVYVDAQGKTKVIATTQMAATDARRVFPCFDEPDFKAVFAVTLVIEPEYKAISNASTKAENLLPGGKREVQFHDTMKMSSYLVALVVGDLEATAPVMVDNTPIRIWAAPGKLHLAKFAEGIAAHSLQFFNSYYGIRYPSDKLDLIAVPDFAYGAMENLGAVIFRETALLVDQKTASHAEMERVADVVAHEIAHMWFGDLTTMRWWNGIWLNEAFATFMQMLALDSWKPEWKRWESFSVDRALAFATDGLRSTRTIEFPVQHPAEAQGMFDVLTYDKGASVLRMLEQYLEPENFRRGVSLYLSKHKYGNTDTTDLWDAIEESSHQPVRGMMDSWIYQEGHPLISISTDSETSTSIVVEQQRFVYESGKEAVGDTDTIFHVPIMIKAKLAKGLVIKKFLLQDKSTKIEFGEPFEYVIVNESGHGFYRVRYDSALLKKLTEKGLESMSAIERFNLINDAWAAVLAGMQTLSDYLTLIRLFKNEKDKNVWSVIFNSLSYLERLGANPDCLKKLSIELATPGHKRLGFEPKGDDDALTKQLRAMFILRLGTTGDDKAIQKLSLELLEKYLADENSVSPDISAALITIAASVGDKKRFDSFVNLFKNGKSPQEEERYLLALASFKDVELLKATLAMTLDGQVRTQNAPYLIRAILHSPVGGPHAWTFMSTNWQTILKTFPAMSLTRMCEGVTSLTSEELVEETREFFEKNPLKQGKKLISQHLEKQRVAVSLKNREAKTLNSF
jgi:puromycin-sensitive aminopeptidase